MTATTPPEEPVSCPCGSPWWRLEQDPDVVNPAVPSFTMDRAGVVTGFCGRPVCIECDTPWAPTRDRLSVVDGGVVDLDAVRDQLVAPSTPVIHRNVP